jgi:hypothetical protein
MPSLVRADDRAKNPPPASARAILKNRHHRATDKEVFERAIKPLKN